MGLRQDWTVMRAWVVVYWTFMRAWDAVLCFESEQRLAFRYQSIVRRDSKHRLWKNKRFEMLPLEEGYISKKQNELLKFLSAKGRVYVSLNFKSNDSPGSRSGTLLHMLTKMDGKTDLYPISNVNKIPDASIKILNSTKFSDPKTMDHSKQLKIDALCELTSIMQRKPGHIDIPAPDYNADYNSNGYLQQIEEISGDKEFLGKAYIKKNMSQEMKMISKDIQLRSKQDVQKRPEFLAKQHQMKTSALRKQEDKEKEENNELLTKLKSRSHKIEEVEKEKTTHDNQPEFMKVKLKSQQRPAAVS